jgi:hypothetical protein
MTQLIGKPQLLQSLGFGNYKYRSAKLLKTLFIVK